MKVKMIQWLHKADVTEMLKTIHAKEVGRNMIANAASHDTT